jgi:membrane protease YdiL (CAAX protease family)
MSLFNNADEKKKFLKSLLIIVLALALIQLSRTFIMAVVWFLLRPGVDITLFQVINGLSFLLVGIILLLIFKPSLKDLGLNWDDIRIRNRLFYFLGVFILGSLVVAPYFLGWGLNILVVGLVFGILTPAFEELLFRGYIWGQMENSAGMVNPGIITWIIVTFLFSIWHLGYMDVFLLHPLKMGSITILIASKLGIGLILGLIVGYLRLKTGKAYAPFLFHGLWNVFAP